MKKTINLLEILKSCDKYNCISEAQKTDVIAAMKEACKQILELAAENAKTMEITELWSGQPWDDGPLPICVDKNSILDTFNWIEI